MKLHCAENSLSQAEKEDQQITRLINKKPAPSRKKAPRRGPKFDNRRKRIQIDDPDLSKKDRDMSMNHKDIGSTADIALRVMFAYDSATSNETFNTESMSAKVATYHGVLQQGHPSGPTNTGYKSVDKRYFNKKHYDSIVSSAKDLLKEDWLKYGWDSGSEDARFRAALDIAISTSDDALYQNKIDVETYNMLLSTLIGVDIDTFSETFWGKTPREAVNKQRSKEDNRSATVMSNQQLVNIIKIANELRHKDPKASFEILRNVAAIRHAQQDDQDQQQDDQGNHTSQQDQQSQQQQGQQDQQGQQQTGQQDQQGQQQQSQQQQGQQDQQGSADAGAVKNCLKELKDAHDGEEAKECIEELAKAAHVSSSRIASDGGLTVIEDLADADVLKLLKDFAPKLVELEDVNDTALLLSGVSELLEEMIEKAGKSKAASTKVNLAALVHLAATVPESRAVLLPILAAAKKKLSKKSKKKNSQQEQKGQQDQQSKKKSPPPFGGKKAPPFGKGKKVPPKGKGRKASLTISDSDCSW